MRLKPHERSELSMEKKAIRATALRGLGDRGKLLDEATHHGAVATT
jgi:hypothetical protein